MISCLIKHCFIYQTEYFLITYMFVHLNKKEKEKQSVMFLFGWFESLFLVIIYKKEISFFFLNRQRALENVYLHISCDLLRNANDLTFQVSVISKLAHLLVSILCFLFEFCLLVHFITEERKQCICKHKIIS